jgi:hypothetical protein
MSTALHRRLSMVALGLILLPLPAPARACAETPRPLPVPAVDAAAPAPASRLAESLGKLPLYFVENRGQLASRVVYSLQGRSETMYFTSQGLTYSIVREKGRFVLLAYRGARRLRLDEEGRGPSGTALVPLTGAFFLRNATTPGPADFVFVYGPPGATPLAGDWDANGATTVGVYVPATGAWFLRNANAPGPAEVVFSYGPPAVAPLAGDWDGL